MNKNTAERNLLYAGLGLQLGILSKDKVIRAFTEWLFDKTKPLREILIAQKALTEEEGKALEIAVEANIKQEGGEKEALASLNQIKDLESDLDHLDDQDLYQTFCSAVSLKQSQKIESTENQISKTINNLLPKPTKSHSINNESINRFERQQFLDAGNLGEIYFARDSELNRTVVNKYIRPDRAHESLTQALFHLEGEVTGALEHPGIVPVYGLGKDSKNRSYYAMRYINGRKLTRVIAEYHNISKGNIGKKQEVLVGLLQSFESACLAIEYAHQKGVIHCDIKPDNIMIGNYGEVFVVDWGLVIVHGLALNTPVEDNLDTLDLGQMPRYQPSDLASSGLHQKQGGSRRGVGGTPAYMAPEQLKATRKDDISLISPATDIYALGSTLFQILTGKAPHLPKKDSKEKITDFELRIMEGKIPAPKDLNPNLPNSLNAIVLKAMCLKPKDRYGSARNLAEDIKRFLADEPVQAYQEPLLEKTKRWVRKNRTLVGAAMVVLMLVTVGAMCFGFITSRFNAQLRVSEGKALNQQKIAEAQKAKAVQANGILVTYLDSGTPSRILKAFIFAFCRPNVVREDMISAAALTSIPNSFFELGEKKILEDSPDDPQFGMHVKLAFAGIYRSRGMLKQALELQNKVLDSTRNNQNLDPWERGLIHREFAWTNQILGDFEAALTNYDLAVAEFKTDREATLNKDSRQARELANLHLLRAYFNFEIFDFEKASKELDFAFLASDDKEIKNITLGLKALNQALDKPFTPELIQSAIVVMDLIAPGASKDIDFLSIVQSLSKKSGLAIFGQKDTISLSNDIRVSFQKHLGEYNFFTILGESQIATFLLRNGKTKEGFALFDQLILKLKKIGVFYSPSVIGGILSPYTDFTLDTNDPDRIEKIYQINKDFKEKTVLQFVKQSQMAIQVNSHYCIVLISMKKFAEARDVYSELLENLKSSNNTIFHLSSYQLLKLIERIEMIDENNEKLKALYELFHKRVTAEFKSTDKFKIKDRIASIEKKLKE